MKDPKLYVMDHGRNQRQAIKPYISARNIVLYQTSLVSNI